VLRVIDLICRDNHSNANINIQNINILTLETFPSVLCLLTLPIVCVCMERAQMRLITSRILCSHLEEKENRVSHQVTKQMGEENPFEPRRRWWAGNQPHIPTEDCETMRIEIERDTNCFSFQPTLFFSNYYMHVRGDPQTAGDCRHTFS